MSTTLSRKIGIKPGTRSILLDAPAKVAKAIGAGATRLAGSFGYIHAFVTSQSELDAAFPKLKRHLLANGMLWISWPKGRALGTDLTLGKVIKIGYGHGLVESKTISVNSTWSAIKFTFPKKGKKYNNSYGRLKRDR